MRRVLIVVCLIVPACGATEAFPQGQSVVDTPHNLSVSGPGVIRAVTEEQVCIFCHTPHNASPIQPLWNRYLPVNAYIVYSSNALDAEPGQPTGASKMCLSCHDGTIALGSVVSQDEIIEMAGGITTLPPGASNLGTDLSDDHPISFRYDLALVAKDPKLADPHQLPGELVLDSNEELQCTTCHQPHDNRFGHFLTMGNDNSAMCRACHQISTTTIPAHAECNACHRPHTAPSGPYLLTGDRITNTCLTCHDGSYPGAKDIASELNKIDVHDTNSPVDPPDPIPDHVTCADCHEPHTMTQGATQPPDVHSNFGQVSGVSASGSPIAISNYEYEVCFKCHGDENAVDTPWVSRQITEVNTRLEFAVTSISFIPWKGRARTRMCPASSRRGPPPASCTAATATALIPARRRDAAGRGACTGPMRSPSSSPVTRPPTIRRRAPPPTPSATTAITATSSLMRPARCATFIGFTSAMRIRHARRVTMRTASAPRRATR